MDRLLRARVVLAEAETMGVSLEDLVAAASTMSASALAAIDPVPSVSEYLAVIRPTFDKGTGPAAPRRRAPVPPCCWRR
jgi:hypothetical protein